MNEKQVAEELLKLVKRPPTTKAEKKFYEWLLEWKLSIEKGKA